ncbi:MAG: phenylalanine--tRNA ligase subunit alpha [bacterium]
MLNKLNKLKKQALDEIKKSETFDSLKFLETKYLGRQGELSGLLADLKKVAKEELPKVGRLANEVKNDLLAEFEKVKKNFQSEKKITAVNLDPTAPGETIERGHLHPITQFLRKVEDIFLSMGFEVLDGPEVEDEEHNFNLLNMPKDHPARDIQDTFYVKGGEAGNQLLLRTQTSPMQIRAMKTRKPPVRLIVPGRVFRHEATDASHETTFYQCEGLVIGENIKMTDLIGTLQQFLQAVFGDEVKVKVRPSFFPFTEPSLEVIMSCVICGQKGCSVCKQTGWLEMLGCGMVHPKVLENMNVDPAVYSGFAFGLGIDRLMMLYHQINDVRLSYGGDLRFLKQF